MTIHNLSDVPYQYTTPDLPTHYYQNDPNSHKEPESVWNGTEYVAAHPVPKTETLIENLTNTYEKDKRVERYFLGQQGQVWVLWHITDIPEVSDDPFYSHIPRDGWGFTAKDGTVTMVTAYLYFTRDRAMEHIREDVTQLSKYAVEADGAFYSHVYELSQM